MTDVGMVLNTASDPQGPTPRYFLHRLGPLYRAAGEYVDAYLANPDYTEVVLVSLPADGLPGARLTPSTLGKSRGRSVTFDVEDPTEFFLADEGLPTEEQVNSLVLESLAWQRTVNDERARRAQKAEAPVLVIEPETDGLTAAEREALALFRSLVKNRSGEQQ